MATTNLGSLSIDLVVNIGNFVEPINQAERKAKSASETIAQSFKTIGSTMKSVSDFMNNQIVAGLTSTVTRVIDTGSEIKKLAQLANTSTSSFQYYAKGAETVGISMDKFANQLKGMQQNIGNFQQTGAGPLADFFKNIAPQVGVTISQFQKLSGPDALQLYYDSLVKANVSQESMRFYMEALISGSTALIPLLENGGAEFKKWGDTAQKAGIIMDDAMIKKLSQAKENLQIMDLQWQGVQATMVNGIMPVFIAVTSHMDTITAAAVGLGAALSVKLAVQGAMVAKEFAIWAIEGVRTVATFASVTIASLQTATAMGVLRGAMAFLGGPVGLGLLAVQALAAGAAFLFMKNSNDETAKSLNEQGVSIAEIVKKYQELDSAGQRMQMRAEKKSLEELNEEYEKSKSKLLSTAIAIGVLNGSTFEASQAARDLVVKFRDGQLTTEQFAIEINKLSGVSEKSKARIDEQAAASIKVGQEFTKQKEVVDALSGTTEQNSKAQGELNVALENQARLLGIMPDKWNAYSQKQRDALTNVLTSQQRQEYIEAKIAEGWTKEKAEYIANYRDQAGLGYTTKIDNDQTKILDNDFQRKNYTFNINDKKKINGARLFVSKNNLEEIAKREGLPAGLLTGLIATESGGENLTSPTGATGPFQTTSIFRRQHAKILKAGGYSEAAYTKAASAELLKGYEAFGNWSDALMAYNGGVAGTRAFKAGRISSQVKNKSGHQVINGQLYLSPAKAKEMQNYPKTVLKYRAGANNSSTVDDSMFNPSQADQLKTAENLIASTKEKAIKKANIAAIYATPEEKFSKEHKGRIDQITETHGGTPEFQKLIDQENASYNAQVLKFKADRENEFNQYFSFETDRIKQIEQNYKYQKSLIDSNADYEYGKSKDALKIKEALDRKKALEIEAVKKEEQQQVQAAIAAYLSETEIVLNRYKLERDEIQKNSQLTKETREKLLQVKDMAIADVLTKNSQKMEDHAIKSLDVVSTKRDPNKAAWDTLQNQYNVANGSIDQDYRDQRAGIFLATDDESERSAQLLAAHQEYLIAKSALDEEYAQREADLTQQQFETKLQVYSQIAGMTGQVFDQMANMVAESAGKSNALYKTMFLASKAASIAQAIVNTEEGATKALAQGGAYGSFLAAFVRATGYASVGIMAAQTIQGFATGGQIRGLGNGLSDSIPIWASNEEFMIKQSSAKKIGLDNLNYMNQTGELPQTESSQIMVPQLAELPPTGNAINAPVSVNVTVNSDGSSQVDSSGQYKLVGEVLGNTIRQVLLQELRQGRILYNAIRG
ncbi:replication protein [Acinetobacter pittii]|uniref:transglycosylase SLT domain-containing protein n=1 Tax=Acinetobacter pittii TaxID=48296 RepID=UPI0019810205|nr:transglycosylase SLT domain-containing protein [Acinetobacter pittii]MBN6517048.1 replication protein [Acinetobacter pittii]